MEHWASAVLETISRHPRTPPPSPAIPPQGPAATRPSSAHDLPAYQARTVDMELDLVLPKPPYGHQSKTPSRATANSSAAQQSSFVGSSASRSGTAKESGCCEAERTARAQPARWWPYAALLGGVFQQCLSTGLVMTYGTILSYYTTHLLHAASSAKLNLIGAMPPFVRHASPNMLLAAKRCIHRFPSVPANTLAVAVCHGASGRPPS